MHELGFTNFEAAAQSAVSFLHRRLGMRLWMVTRVQGNDWIVLKAEDHGYDVKDGTVFRWSDSFCSRMVRGEGPRIAPRADDVPAYAAAPIGRLVKIGAYVGIPLKGVDGELFGTLCAIDPEVQPPGLQEELELVEMVGAMLGALLRSELMCAAEMRAAERVRAEALIDPLTGLFNRRGWSELLDREEDRCRRYGNPAAVLTIDLDGLKAVNDNEGHFAGDRLIERTGKALRGVLRGQDVGARVGGDEFAILAVECPPGAVTRLQGRVREALDAAGLEASVGVAGRDPAHGLKAAWEASDQAMYAEKAQKAPAQLPRPQRARA